MNWTALPILVAAFVSYFFYKRSGLISIKDARAYLKSGALVIDVRTAGEFVAHHLPIAVNLPAGETETSVTRRVKDKDQVLLLHCQSGARSSIAKKKLKSLGYLNTFNLGSYDRASHIVYGK